MDSTKGRNPPPHPHPRALTCVIACPADHANVPGLAQSNFSCAALPLVVNSSGWRVGEGPPTTTIIPRSPDTSQTLLCFSRLFPRQSSLACCQASCPTQGHFRLRAAKGYLRLRAAKGHFRLRAVKGHAQITCYTGTHSYHTLRLINLPSAVADSQALYATW
jgi:hypothetical protein